jgi:hypothetical protein
LKEVNKKTRRLFVRTNEEKKPNKRAGEKEKQRNKERRKTEKRECERVVDYLGQFW